MSESKKELIEEHRRLVRILKEGTRKEQLEEYERQLKELKKLVAGKEYEPENVSKALTPNVNYKGGHSAMVDGKWYRVKNVGVDKERPVVSHPGENWYELEGHPEGIVHQNRIEDYDEGLSKSNYGPKGAGLYDPTVNQKRKAKNVETVESLGQNKNVKEYTSATLGTAKEQADAQAKKDLAVNRRQPVKSLKDLTPEEKAALEAKYNAKIAKIEKSLKAMKKTLEASNPQMNLQQVLAEIQHRQPTDAEIAFILSEQAKNVDAGSAEAELRNQEERYRQLCEEE